LMPRSLPKQLGGHCFPNEGSWVSPLIFRQSIMSDICAAIYE
jgi:hypothetical protein